jgi:hypothetical protein
MPVALGLCTVLAFVALAIRHTVVSSHSRRTAASSLSTSAVSRAVPPPREQPAGCPRSSDCEVSHRVTPSVLSAVRRYFATARPLNSYTVRRVGPTVFGGGLQYRQVAFSVPDGLLLITVRARSGPPPFPSFWLTHQGSAADVHVSLANFDFDLRTNAIGAQPVSGDRLLALADESALTDVV